MYAVREVLRDDASPRVDLSDVPLEAIAGNTTRVARRASQGKVDRMTRLFAWVVVAFLSVTSVSAQVLAPWTAQDIGAPAIAGTSTQSGNTFTVTAGGTDIWNAADQFRFISQPLVGDGTVIARVDGLVNTQAFAKAGVMIRGSVAANAQNVLAYMTGDQRLISSRRTTVGGASTSTSGTVVAGPPPVWVRLTRLGNAFTAYRSTDGVSWTILAQPVTVAMPANAVAGLAIASATANTATTAVFSNVSVTPTVTVPNPPTLTSVAPSSGIVGSAVILAGTNFGTSQGTSTVTFNGILAAPATAWGASGIAVTVPAGASTGNVVVTVGGIATAGRLFTVAPTPPTGVIITASSQLVWDEMGADVTTLGTYIYTAYVDNIKGPTLPSTCAVVSATQFSCTAPVPLASLVVGTHNVFVTATFNGIESPASNVVVATVEPIMTATVVVMTGITTAATFTATVTSGAGTPTGSVVFKDNGQPLLAMPLSPAGTVTWTVMNVSLGPHDWEAIYTGTGAYSSSASPVLHTVVTIQ